MKLMAGKRIFYAIGIFWIFTPAAADSKIGVEDCSTCHREITREWRSSLHAQAYISPVFLKRKEELSDSGQSSCSCHAPDNIAPEFLGAVPEEREDSLHLGVDCLACHMDKDMVAWSSGEQRYVPHFTRMNRMYSQGRFCTGCHRWGKGTGFDCQECHMPELRGANSDGPHIGKVTGATHRSHSWPGSRNPEILAQGAVLTSIRNGKQLSVSVTNVVGAHSFPVGDHHRAEIVVLSESSLDPVWGQSVKLAPDSTAEYSVKLRSARARAIVELRFYPAPAVWPDSFYVLYKEMID